MRRGQTLPRRLAGEKPDEVRYGLGWHGLELLVVMPRLHDENPICAWQ